MTQKKNKGTVLVVTSGKGGVGKTTSTASIGSALAKAGQKTILIDFDVGLRNLDLIMGLERRIIFNMIDVIEGRATLSQAIVTDKHSKNLFVLPTSQTSDKNSLKNDGVARIIESLKNEYDWIICDSPAGIESGAAHAMRHADKAIIVTNPEISSVRDSDRIIGILDSQTIKAEQGLEIPKHVLITRYNTRRAHRNSDMLTIEDIQKVLGIPLIGIIPESQSVLQSSNTGIPIPIRDPKGPAAIAYTETALRLLGKRIPVKEPPAPGLFARIMGTD